MKQFLMLFRTREHLPFGDWPTPQPAPNGDPFSVGDYVATLQRDGRLLLRYLARRSDIVAPDVTTGTVSADDNVRADVLFKSPETIGIESNGIGELIHAVDVLSRRARPANVRSIRLTSAYLGMAVEGGEPPKDIAQESRRIKRYIRWLNIGALIVFVFALGFLANVDYGRRLLQDVDKLRQIEHTNETELSALPPGSFRAMLQPPDGGAKPAPQSAAPEYQGPFCEAEKLQSSSSGSQPDMPFLQPIKSNAMDKCREAYDIRTRMDLVYVGLADWNCWNNPVFPVGWILATLYPVSHDCGKPISQPQLTQLPNWRSHETRVVASMSVMTGFALPLMLGFLGGYAYALRQHDLKLAAWTLEPQDGMHTLARVLLAALLGGLVGVIWTSESSVTLGGFTLSLAAVAFFVGFSVEAVFRLIQTLIDGVVSTIRSPETATVPESSITAFQVRRIARDVVATQANAPVTDSGSTPTARQSPGT